MLTKLRKLKELFDVASPELKNDYWSEEILQTYSESLGERIKWKWDAFLADIVEKRLHPDFLFEDINFEVTDWGCGPGTASAAFAQSFPQKDRLSFLFEDRSTLAQSFAKRRLEKILGIKASLPKTDKKIKILLISYVLTELSKADEKKLFARVSDFDLFFWVDAGTHSEGRKLSELRNSLLDKFYFLAPCPHQKICPLSGSQNPQDWCHRFAETPQVAFHSAKWAEISKVLNIDLKSLPYASLYGIKKQLLEKLPELPDQELGRPRVGKHEITLDFCTKEGNYAPKKVTKRAEPDLFKKLRKRF